VHVAHMRPLLEKERFFNEISGQKRQILVYFGGMILIVVVVIVDG